MFRFLAIVACLALVSNADACHRQRQPRNVRSVRTVIPSAPQSCSSCSQVAQVQTATVRVAIDKPTCFNGVCRK